MINWSLLGPALSADPGAALQMGFEKGATRAALGRLTNDPTDQKALGVLGQFDPQAAMQMREHGRQEQFRRGALAAYDPATGAVDPVAMRQAYVGTGDVAGAMRFDQDRAAGAAAQRKEGDALRERLARLADEAGPENWQQVRAMALEIAPGAQIPEQYDPQWVQQQKLYLKAFGDQEQATSLMREVQAAGYDLGTPDGQAYFRRLLENRYAPPLQAVDVELPGGAVERRYIQRPTGSAPPPPLSDDDFVEGDRGGNAPGGFR